MSSTPFSPAALLHARYGTPQPAPEHWSATLAGLLAHRSVRAFASTPVSDAVLDVLLAAAQSAPTSCNLQAWSVVRVDDPARRSRLAALSGEQDCIRQAPVYLVWLADHRILEKVAQAAEAPSAALDYLDSSVQAIVDVALAAQNFVVAAESLGLGAVYIGGLRRNLLAVARELALPRRTFALFGLCLGYPDVARPAQVRPRLPQSVVLHRETYADRDIGAEVAAYDGRHREFFAGQGLDAPSWSARARTPARHRIPAWPRAPARGTRRTWLCATLTRLPPGDRFT